MLYRLLVLLNEREITLLAKCIDLFDPIYQQLNKISFEITAKCMKNDYRSAVQNISVCNSIALCRETTKDANQ